MHSIKLFKNISPRNREQEQSVPAVEEEFSFFRDHSREKKKREQKLREYQAYVSQEIKKKSPPKVPSIADPSLLSTELSVLHDIRRKGIERYNRLKGISLDSTLGNSGASGSMSNTAGWQSRSTDDVFWKTQFKKNYAKELEEQMAMQATRRKNSRDERHRPSPNIDWGEDGRRHAERFGRQSVDPMGTTASSTELGLTRTRNNDWMEKVTPRMPWTKARDQSPEVRHKMQSDYAKDLQAQIREKSSPVRDRGDFMYSNATSAAPAPPTSMEQAGSPGGGAAVQMQPSMGSMASPIMMAPMPTVSPSGYLGGPMASMSPMGMMGVTGMAGSPPMWGQQMPLMGSPPIMQGPAVNFGNTNFISPQMMSPTRQQQRDEELHGMVDYLARSPVFGDPLAVAMANRDASPERQGPGQAQMGPGGSRSHRQGYEQQGGQADMNGGGDGAEVQQRSLSPEAGYRQLMRKDFMDGIQKQLEEKERRKREEKERQRMLDMKDEERLRRQLADINEQTNMAAHDETPVTKEGKMAARQKAPQAIPQQQAQGQGQQDEFQHKVYSSAARRRLNQLQSSPPVHPQMARPGHHMADVPEGADAAGEEEGDENREERPPRNRDLGAPIFDRSRLYEDRNDPTFSAHMKNMEVARGVRQSQYKNLVQLIEDGVDRSDPAGSNIRPDIQVRKKLTFDPEESEKAPANYFPTVLPEFVRSYKEFAEKVSPPGSAEVDSIDRLLMDFVSWKRPER